MSDHLSTNFSFVLVELKTENRRRRAHQTMRRSASAHGMLADTPLGMPFRAMLRRRREKRGGGLPGINRGGDSSGRRGGRGGDHVFPEPEREVAYDRFVQGRFTWSNKGPADRSSTAPPRRRRRPATATPSAARYSCPTTTASGSKSMGRLLAGKTIRPASSPSMFPPGGRPRQRPTSAHPRHHGHGGGSKKTLSPIAARTTTNRGKGRGKENTSTEDADVVGDLDGVFDRIKSHQERMAIGHGAGLDKVRTCTKRTN